jgi:hypothetical protein
MIKKKIKEQHKDFMFSHRDLHVSLYQLVWKKKNEIHKKIKKSGLFICIVKLIKS